MAELIFDEDDVKQIERRGMTLEKVISQIEIFKKGFPYCELERPCTIGDGITVFQKDDLERLGKVFVSAASSGRTMKFVPASGAASRMFKLLLSFNNSHDSIDEKQVVIEAEKNDPDHKAFLQFIEGIKKFAFYDDLKSVMLRDGLDMESLISEGQYERMLEYILTAEGLSLADLPKGLITFHKYPDQSRTPIEEHLVEAVAYTQAGNKTVHVHFTVSLEHEDAIKEHIKKIRRPYEKSGVKYDVTLSVQKDSTDTIAVNLNNEPFRDRDGRLLFRPGGHGALLENLNDLKGDIIPVFIQCPAPSL